MEEQNQQEPTQEVVEIKDLVTFYKLLMQWYTTKIKTLEHIMEIPNGTIVSITDDEKPENDETGKITLEGKFAEAFKAGVMVSLSELSDFPFFIDNGQQQSH